MAARLSIYQKTPALGCCYASFCAEHMLFGTDMPYDSQLGLRQVRKVINSIEGMDATPRKS
jgi:hypothetical protein